MYDLTRIPQIAESLDEMQNECLITLAMKISDDTCKMDEYEQSVFMRLYDALPGHQSKFFESNAFELISRARNEPTAQIFAQIKPLREAGMAYITRPRMKTFKAVVREGLQ